MGTLPIHCFAIAMDGVVFKKKKEKKPKQYSMNKAGVSLHSSKAHTKQLPVPAVESKIFQDKLTIHQLASKRFSFHVQGEQREWNEEEEKGDPRLHLSKC